MAAKRILMIVGDFAEDYEVMVPFQMMAPSRRNRTFDPRVMVPFWT
jgi:hypothetical protein